MKNKILDVMDKYPTLTTGGFSIWNKRKETFEEYQKRLIADRAELLDERSIKMVETCLDWLKLVDKRKTINNYSSYGLKHIVERWSGNYIYNGCFIVAGLIAGLNIKIYFGSPNASFNISQKSIKQFEKERS
jgi:hypothetical protein